MLTIRPATTDDHPAIWAMLEPAIRAGEVFALPLEMTRQAALEYWFAPAHHVFVAMFEGTVAGAYYVQPNQQGGGSHVANCGYLTAAQMQGQGVARAMCLHSLEQAKSLGFRAMQFNFVVSTNLRAVHLWQSCGFRILATLPGAFHHPKEGFVDTFVMWRDLWRFMLSARESPGVSRVGSARRNNMVVGSETTVQLSEIASNEIALKEIAQIGLTVEDLPLARDFYRDVLGLPLLFEAGTMAFFQCGAIRLMLGTAEKPAPRGGTILYYKVGDLHATCAALEAKGVSFLQTPQLVAKMPDHELWMAFLKDPDENTLALMSEVR
jgi:catechol 2,3-dioxygenase-like lactoylglutathione lyase family enzyme/ribosomal protein S18 acetylase RimI-like enzyme